MPRRGSTIGGRASRRAASAQVGPHAFAFRRCGRVRAAATGRPRHSRRCALPPHRPARRAPRARPNARLPVRRIR
ncbi:hypothetical protein WJ04_25400 [Burkholderia vietnamiensis]|nr:hypothetical protein WJ04_25400 [Burkholderia vietnamiensis]